MDYLFSIIKGAIRGFSELSGLSASGHCALAGRLIPFPAGLHQNGLEELMSLGLLAAVLLVFYKDIWEMLSGLWKMLTNLFSGSFKWRKASRGQVMAVSLILASLPLGVAWLVRRYLYDYVARFSGNLLFTGVMLLITAALIFLGDHSLDQKKELRDMKPIEAVKLGLFGAFALLPGLSPLATAMAMGMNMGFKRKDALEFAFLMVIPSLFAGGPGWAPLAEGTSPIAAGLAVAAALLAGLAGVFLLKWLVKKNRLLWPTLYCGLAGIAAIVLNFIG